MSNVITPQQWPSQRPGPTPPSCFSELYRLNQCYDDIRMMEQILQKVICDMAANNAEFQQCLVDGITKGGSNVPLIGVTNGSNAQPGQVGEFVPFQQTVNFPTGTNTQMISMGVLQPGDWDCWAWSQPQTAVIEDASFYLDPVPPGFSNALPGAVWGVTAGAAANTLVSATCRASISVPTLLAFGYATVATAAGAAVFQVECRRAR